MSNIACNFKSDHHFHECINAVVTGTHSPPIAMFEAGVASVPAFLVSEHENNQF